MCTLDPAGELTVPLGILVGFGDGEEGRVNGKG